MRPSVNRFPQSGQANFLNFRFSPYNSFIVMYSKKETPFPSSPKSIRYFPLYKTNPNPSQQFNLP